MTYVRQHMVILEINAARAFCSELLKHPCRHNTLYFLRGAEFFNDWRFRRVVISFLGFIRRATTTPLIICHLME